MLMSTHLARCDSKLGSHKNQRHPLSNHWVLPWRPAVRVLLSSMSVTLARAESCLDTVCPSVTGTETTWPQDTAQGTGDRAHTTSAATRSTENSNITKTVSTF